MLRMRLRRVDTLPEERIFLRAQLPAIAFSFFHPDTRSSRCRARPCRVEPRLPRLCLRFVQRLPILNRLLRLLPPLIIVLEYIPLLP
jgi:hypothetical protein